MISEFTKGLENPIEKEVALSKQLFDYEHIVKFQLNHDIQIERDADYNYNCFIDGKSYATGLTFLFALLMGISAYENNTNDILKTINGFCEGDILTQYEVLEFIKDYYPNINMLMFWDVLCLSNTVIIKKYHKSDIIRAIQKSL